MRKKPKYIMLHIILLTYYVTDKFSAELEDTLKLV